MAYGISVSSSQSTNAGANQSTVSATVFLTWTNKDSYSGYNFGGSVTIGGSTVGFTMPSSFFPSTQTGSVAVGSHSVTYTHDNNGVRGAVGTSGVINGPGGFAPGYLATSGPTQGAINYDRRPGQPAAPTLSRTGDGTSITVTSAVAPQLATITDYRYQYGTNNSTWSSPVSIGTGRVGTQTGLTNTQDYYFQTSAFADGNWGPWSPSTFVQGVPTVPTSVVGTASSSVSGRITVTWTTPSDTNGGITNYEVFRDGTSVGFTGNSTTSYIDNGLTKGTNYVYTVRAYNAIGFSSLSAASTATQAPGVPYAPTLDTVVASTDTFGKVTLSWTAPSTAVGTIQNYYLYADGVLQTATVGAVTSADITGLNQRQIYAFTVRARNQFSIDNGTPGDVSNSISRKSPGPPTAPTSLTSSAPFSPPGTVDLAWVTPTDVGTEGGTITGYSIFLAGSTSPIKTTTGTGTSTTIEDLIPATTYTFNVRARNEIADIVGTFSAASNSTTATAQGEPEAPTGLTVVPDPVVAGRLILTWIPPVGYNTGFRVYTGAGALIANISVPRLEIDGLAPNTSLSYKVRARNPLTDLTGSEGGPFSATVAGLVGGSSTQMVPSISVVNNTNSTLVGTYSLTGTTATSMSYTKVATNIPFASVPVGGGATLNNTNTNLNGSYVVSIIGDAQTSAAVTYSKAGPDIPANTSTPSGTMFNNTNALFNGNFEVLDVPEPDSVAKTLSYFKTSSDISSRTSAGQITNNTNVVYNGEYVISDIEETTISYEQISEDLPETDAFGVVLNKTNTDIFNGTYTIFDTPDFKTLEYQTGDLTYAENLVTNPSFETVVSGSTVFRTNLITNPSFDTNVTGWATSSSSIARRSDIVKYGTNSALISPTTNTGFVSISATLPATEDYTLSAWVFAFEERTVKLSHDGTYGPEETIPAEEWTQISATFAGTSGSVSVGIESVGSTVPFYIDGVLLEQTSELRPYFDGETVDSLGWDYGWTGTANASTSTAKADSELAVAGYSPIPFDTTSCSYSWAEPKSGDASLKIELPTVLSMRPDSVFAENTGGGALSAWIQSIATQSDGKILVGGNFTTFNGTSAGRFIRLNSDGTRDTAFMSNTGTGSGSIIYTVASQSDGKVLLGGSFTNWNGTTVRRIVRLNSDGTQDTTFTTNLGTGANNLVHAIFIQSDGKILVGGAFSTWDGTTVGRIVRLNSDGTRDTTFTTNTGTNVTGSVVYDFAEQSDGKILAVGGFSTFDGTSASRIVRLNSDGTRDSSFSVGSGPNNPIFSVKLQSDGKILVGGSFVSWSPLPIVPYIARLNSDGSLDTAFNSNIFTGFGAGPNLDVLQIALQADGKIIIGGLFSTYSGTTVNRIVRLNSDGTRDTTFSSYLGTAANNRINTVHIQPDGELLLGGQFTEWNSQPTGGVVRLEEYQRGTLGGVETTVNVSSGSTYTFSGWVYSQEAINVVAASTNPTTESSTVAVPAETWTRVSVTFTADNSSTDLSIISEEAVVFYVDDFMLQESSTLQDYFDGDTDDVTDTWPVVYTWAGTPNASISIREVGGTLPEVGAEILLPYGEASRVQSEAQLQIRYRSGWLG